MRFCRNIQDFGQLPEDNENRLDLHKTLMQILNNLEDWIVDWKDARPVATLSWPRCRCLVGQ